LFVYKYAGIVPAALQCNSGLSKYPDNTRLLVRRGTH